ncbi:MAG: hypothetical protein JSS82_11120 [Bacteroidetes bacterium]|nr:hypothetical protein [Bacteroidota bacterium]
MSEAYSLLWQGEDIGTYEIVQSDMGIFDGHWTGNDNPKARDFEKLINTFEIKKVFAKPQLGTMAMLIRDRNEIHVFVLGMIDGMLTLKMVADQGAIDWLEKTTKKPERHRSILVRMFRSLFRKRA